MSPLSKCGNAGRIAGWILGEIGDPLDYWCHGNGVTSAELVVRLAMGDTVVTLENKWWGVRGSVTYGHYCDDLLALWKRRPMWAPPWLRDRFSASWATKVLHDSLKDRESFSWDEQWRKP